MYLEHTAVKSVLAQGARAGARSAEGRDGSLPLQLALQYQADEPSINALLELFPDGAGHRTLGGMLPLHLAAFYTAPETVVAKLLRIYPEALYSCIFVASDG